MPQQNFQLAAYQGIDWADTFIKIWTGENGKRALYSHCALYDGYRRIEAFPGIGVRYASLSADFGGAKVDLFDINFDIDVFRNGAVKQAMWRFMEKQHGKKYDFWGLFGFGVANKKWQDPEAWFCSELIAAACCDAGQRLDEKLDPCLISPQKLTSYTPFKLVSSIQL